MSSEQLESLRPPGQVKLHPIGFVLPSIQAPRWLSAGAVLRGR